MTTPMADVLDRGAVKAAILRATSDGLNGEPNGDIVVKGCIAADYVDPENAAEAFIDAIADEVLSEIRARLSQAGAGGVDAVAMNVARELTEVAVAALAASPSAGEDAHHPDFDDGYQWVRDASRATPPAPVQTAGVEAVVSKTMREVIGSEGGVPRVDYYALKKALISSLTAPTQGDGERPILAEYTNWRGERSIRTFIPRRVFWGSNEWHPEPQVLIEAYDCEKEALRTFAASGFATPSSPVSSPSTGEVVEALKAIAEGYPMQVHDDRYIIVENPDHCPDNGSSPKLVIDVSALNPAPGHGEGGL